MGRRVGSAGQPLAVDPGLEPADLEQLVGADPIGGIADRVDHRDEAGTELGVADHEPRAQQRLGLPGR